MKLYETVNKICGALPEGWVINLCMENGSAWVECFNPDGSIQQLPETDQGLEEQLNDALCVANGWEQQ